VTTPRTAVGCVRRYRNISKVIRQIHRAIV
jgi:hypothetical protein